MSSQASQAHNHIRSTFKNSYRVLRHLERNEIANVYLAKSVTHDKFVTLEVIHPELTKYAKLVERFQREVKSAASLTHPNIVAIDNWGREKGVYYVAREHLECRSIAKVLRSTGPLNPNRAAKIVHTVAAALDTAHNAGVIHGNLRPHHIMITDEGKVRISGFGTAGFAMAYQATNAKTSTNTADQPADTHTDNINGLAAASLTATSTDSTDSTNSTGSANSASSAGSAAHRTARLPLQHTLQHIAYLSPEQVQGLKADRRSDMYSLGVILYEMILGELPFQADDAKVLAAKHVKENPVSLTDQGVAIAESLDAITLKLLAKNPTHRYPAASDLLADLKRYLSGAHTLSKTRAKQQPNSTVAQPPHGAAQPSLTQSNATQSSEAQPSNMNDGSATRSSAVQNQQHIARRNSNPNQAAQASPPAAQASSPTPTAQASSPATYYYEEVATPYTWHRNALMFIGLAVLIAVLGFLGLFFYRQIWPDNNSTNGEDLIAVPNVLDLEYQAAENRLRSLGLTPKSEFGVNNDVSENIVFNQNPPAGQRLGRHEQVILSVSKNVIPKVPSVRGKPEEDAKTQLEQAGYTVIVFHETHKAARGIVVEQVPVGGAELDPSEDAVTITVSTGRGKIYIPSVLGSTRQEAVTKLTDLGLLVSTREEPSRQFDSGEVIRTEPEVGTPVDPSSNIVLVISDGPALVTVPQVLNQQINTARALIESAGLVLGSISYVDVSQPYEVGRVKLQDPVQGDEVLQGTLVNLFVGQLSLGDQSDTPTTTTTPASPTTSTAPTTTRQG